MSRILTQRDRILGRIGALALAIILFGLLFFAYVGWNFNRPSFPLERLERLEPGMASAEVRELLGEPTSVYGGASEGKTWCYSRYLSWPIVYVHFDEQGRFQEHIYDY